jgi:hypothetical protein
MALTTHERLIDTPRPLYICLRKNWIRGESTFSPFECRRELRWYMLLAESIGSGQVSESATRPGAGKGSNRRGMVTYIS